MVTMAVVYYQDLNSPIYEISHTRNASGNLSFPLLVVTRSDVNDFDLQIGSHYSNTTIIKMV